MSEIEQMTMYHLDPDKYEMHVEMVYQDSVLDEMARRVGDKLDKEILARLGYVKPVLCRECKQADIGNAKPELVNPIWCRFCHWYVNPNDYCSWGVSREETE